MKLLKIKVKGLELFSSELEIDFLTQQRVRNEQSDMMFKLAPKIYQNNAIAMIGLNASGKTTTLKVVAFVLRMLNNEPINNISNTILNGLQNNKEIEFETYICSNLQEVFKLRTVIREGAEETKYYISEEQLWRKDLNKIRTRKSLYDFDGKEPDQIRDGREEYLPEDVSIIIAHNKKNDDKIFYKDLLQWTNLNTLHVLRNYTELFAFLDPSIEYLKPTFAKGNKKVEFILKFYNKDEMTISTPIELSNYLSSGTIKGINVFINAIYVLTNGGYLVLDELENHFNKEIAATLIRFFGDRSVNKKGATIIYSTHYSELLDEFERNDNIYIVKNNNGIIVENLAGLLQRNDLKKSEVYQSGYLEGTNPTYEAYMELKKSIVKEIG